MPIQGGSLCAPKFVTVLVVAINWERCLGSHFLVVIELKSIIYGCYLFSFINRLDAWLTVDKFICVLQCLILNRVRLVRRDQLDSKNFKFMVIKECLRCIHIFFCFYFQ